MNTINELEEHYTIAELMKLLKISRTTIDTYVKNGRLHKTKIGRKVLFSASEINRFLGKQKA